MQMSVVRRDVFFSEEYALLRSALHNLCFWFYEYVYILFVDLTPGIFK